jgi:hypothetical protein
MTDKPQKPAAKLTTEQAIQRLFPKPVVELVKREIGRSDPPKKSMPKE